MSHNIELKEGAFIIADAHFSHLRVELFEFIKAIYEKKLNPTQLILMGDIFDALFGGVDYTLELNDKLVGMLNEISKDIEVIYLEGNHDFNLKNVFKNAKVFTISQQPIRCSYKDKIVLLAHGDFDSNLGYKIYTSFIRNKYILWFLNIIDSITNHSILKSVDKHLDKKDDCKEFIGFKEFIKRRIFKKYQCDYFIEAHYHQNKNFTFDGLFYINLGAFACNQRYFSVEFSHDTKLLEERYFSKEV
jgi:UDP-2,3-diacylglucosamine hydrolase